MSAVQIEDPVWAAIMADDQLANARRKLSFHEIRLIIRHAQNAGCPFCQGRSAFKSVDEFCERHRALYDATGAA